MRMDWIGLLLIPIVGSCVGPDPTGQTMVRAVTEGGDPDQDGYLVVVDGVVEQQLPATGQKVIMNLATGVHEFAIQGIASNCEDTYPRVRTIEVSSDHRTDVEFTIHCYATGFRIRTVVQGIDLDPRFDIFLDDRSRQETVSSNNTVRVTWLMPGQYTVSLRDVAPNCMLDAASRTVVVEARRVTPVEFTGRCVAMTGAVVVRVRVTGEDLDHSGFTAATVGGQGYVTAGSEVVVSEVSPGDRPIHLTGVAANCAVAGANPRNVLVRAGGMVRDTAAVMFDVTCARTWGLALVRDGQLALASPDGTIVETLPGHGGRPAWAPDGQRLAYECMGICVLNMQTMGVDTLDGSGADVSWRPDGGQLLFTVQQCRASNDLFFPDCYFHHLALLTPGASAPTPIVLPANVISASELAWSRNGALIAMSCVLKERPESRICLVRPDGAGFQVLQTGPGYWFSPSWGPDGRLTVTTTQFGNHEIVVMNGDGTGLRRLNPPASGTHPEWSPDGTHILYSSLVAGRSGLVRVNVDGSGAVRVTTRPGDGPAAWRP